MRSGCLIAWFGAVVLLASISQAQTPRGDNQSRGGNRGRPRVTRETLFRLLEMPLVRQELRLRPLQIELLDDLQADLSEQRRAAFSSGGSPAIPSDQPRGGDAEASQNRLDAMRTAVEKIRLQGEKLVSVILDTDQNTRLLQLRLQDEGARAFERPEFREQLGVTREQFEQIQTLRRAEDDPALSRRLRQQKMDEAVQALLNQEQQAKYKELQGEAFEFPLQLPAELRGLRESLDGNRPGRPAN